MYLIEIKIHQDQVPENQATQLLDQHRQWFSKQATFGYFLLVGPFKDREMAGLVIAQVADKQELLKIIQQDAYYPDLATYEIQEFQANIIAENFADYQGK